MTFMKFIGLASAGIIFAACSPKQQAPKSPLSQGSAQPSVSVSAGAQVAQSTKAANATVFGQITDDGWYMVAAGTRGVKPLVIWTRARSDCETSAAEFNLKSVDPSGPGEPAKAWCAQGRDLRGQLKI